MLEKNGICVTGRLARKALRVCETTPWMVCKQISHLRAELMTALIGQGNSPY
jgi:hypothetical protein